MERKASVKRYRIKREEKRGEESFNLEMGDKKNREERKASVVRWVIKRGNRGEECISGEVGNKGRVVERKYRRELRERIG